ncbi:hypothetical protein L228DRAFT_239121 [Xylona heveae TC161]|uniref:SWI/SNF family DNA-dependent ATPase Ris1 n=1 Tax=Xylona heveae (strain CBS 132557 / TC161) TaxID=1328760 RepID=A0A165GEZ9_XYLHT|nr:hypothetical protein L228DRAFT_239121 [Xylona heveae TC161]KZF22107.1 hypothetical protein L228DRAFT_239121 [Xylona heveae TC161]
MGNFSGISGVSSDDDDELLEISANEFQHNTRSPPLHPTSASGSALSRTRRYGNLNPSADFIDIDDLEDAMSPLPSLPSTRLPSQNSSASFDIQPGRRDHYNKPDERSRFSSAVDAVRQGSATIGSHLSNLGSAVGRWMNVPEGYQPASPYGNLYGYPYSNEYGGAYGYGYPSPFGMPYGADRSMPGGSNSSYFNHLSHMVQSGKYGPNLSGDAFQALADRYDYIVNDPTKTREEIKALLDNIRPDEELPPENREGTPDGLKYPLMEHQKLGLSWLKKMEEGSNKGGILADDMGLGKTIQALALMLFRPSSDTRQKTTLIVAPVALLRQWEREIQTKVNTNHRLTTYLLHGVNKKNVTWNRIREHDVVLTTYGTLASEYNQKESAKRARRANPALRGVRTEKLLLLGDECRFHRVILDEAQCIKNKDTKAARAACCLQASTRFCMTGTPMMNNVEELYSLICFLRIKPYNELERFNKDFKRPLKGTSEAGKEQAMRKLQALLKAILLRRNKKSKIDGRPILQLPERTTEVVHAVFDNDESEFYRALETKTVLQFNKYLKAGTVGRNYSNILVLLLRLRQACCHPHLIKDFGVAANAELSTNDMLALAKELAPDVVARIKEIAAFECPVCYDAVENPAIFLPCGHDTCSECFTRISDPSQALTLGNEDPVVKCPSCRQVISPKRVIDYVSFKKVHMPTEAENEENEEEEEEEEEEEDVDSATESDEDDGDEDENDDDSETSSLGGFVVDDERTDDQDEEKYAQGDNPFSKAKNGGTQKKTRSKGKGKGKAKESKAPRKTLGQLKKEALRSVKAKRRYMRRLARDWVSSAKIDKACELLQQISDRKDGQKTIVFSQFTSLLDLLEVPVDRNGWGYRRYDGSMTAKHRHQAVIDFTDNPDCTIMLVSLKAGNAGLNLVAASQVIILDPFWNPYIEEQAIDRAHRIGQMRPVQVHRILVKDTVEDRIIDLQEKKRELIEGALDEKASQNISRLGTRELAFLFGVSNH